MRICKLLSGAVVLAYIGILYGSMGDEGIFRVMMFSFVPILCIWIPDYMIGFFTYRPIYSCKMVTEKQVFIFGWVVLLSPVWIGLLSAFFSIF